MPSKRDYYDVLGVPRDAQDDEIKRAFRRLAMEYHPDRNRSPDASERFKEVNEAYQVLIDGEKRARYDRFGHAGVSPSAAAGAGVNPNDVFSGFGGFGDIFETFFGDVGAGGRTAARQGEDVQGSLRIGLKDAVFGTTRTVEVDRVEQCATCRGSGADPEAGTQTCASCRGAGQVRRVQRSVFGQFVQVGTCQACEGRGRVAVKPCAACRGLGMKGEHRKLEVRIPAGVEDGMRVQISGAGHAGVRGGSPGDLLITVEVEPDPVFRREGDDLVLDLPITITQAALGDVLTVPTIDGENESVRVPAGTQPGTVFRVKGKGAARLRAKGRGDLLATAVVQVPTLLTPKQRALVEALDASLRGREDGADPSGADPSKDRHWRNKLKDALGG